VEYRAVFLISRRIAFQKYAAIGIKPFEQQGTRSAAYQVLQGEETSSLEANLELENLIRRMSYRFLV